MGDMNAEGIEKEEAAKVENLKDFAIRLIRDCQGRKISNLRAVLKEIDAAVDEQERRLNIFVKPLP